MAQVQFGSTLLPPTIQANGGFGAGMAISGDGKVLAVGFPMYDGAFTDQGCVAIYDWTGSNWLLRSSVLTASDAAASDFFGKGVALNSDGSVMAVGAPQWEGANTNQGGVYIYDWSGTAWVQRGSVMTAGDAAAQDQFGSSVALSSDGTILLVGAYRWESGATNNIGAAYRFVWNGSSWVPFASGPVVGGDVVTGYNLGWSVAVSGDGLVMAAGAPKIDAVSSPFTGRVHIYDWNGTTYVQRGTALLPADSADNDAFGSGVALDNDGGTLIVGAYGRGPDQRGAFYIYDWSGAAWVLREAVTLSPTPTDFCWFGSAVATNQAGTIIAAGEERYDGTQSNQGAAYTYGTPAFGSATGPLALSLALAVASSSKLVLPLSLKPRATGTLTASLNLIVTDLTAYASPQTRWGTQVVLDGVDITSRIAGQISIDSEEGAARLAKFSYFPTGPFNPSGLVGRRVEIGYHHFDLDGVQKPTIRRFTGLVDIPDLDVTNGLVSISATDNRQNQLMAATREQINAMTPGATWSPWVFDESLQGLEYLEARLSTLAASLDKDTQGAFRLTPWQSKTVPDFSYGIDQHFYSTPSLQIARRDRLVNTVDIGFDYRFPRLRLRQIFHFWEATVDGYHLTGFPNVNFACLPSTNTIKDAAKATGWEIAYFQAAIISLPLLGTFVIDDLANVKSFELSLRKRWGQLITEPYALKVLAENSVSAIGSMAEREASAGQVEFDISAWESDAAMPPVIIPPNGAWRYGDLFTDVTSQTADGRAVADAAMETLVARAITRIKYSHRANRVSFTIPLDPRLDLIHTVQITTQHLTAKGKIGRLEESMNLETGAAEMTITLHLSGVANTGIPSDPATTPPPPPPVADPPEVEYVRWLRTQTNPLALDYEAEGWLPCMAGTVAPQFKINTPAIDDATERQPINALVINKTYLMNVPIDVLTWS